MAEGGHRPSQTNRGHTHTCFSRKCYGLLGLSSLFTVRQYQVTTSKKEKESTVVGEKVTLKEEKILLFSNNAPDDSPFLVTQLQVIRS